MNMCSRWRSAFSIQSCSWCLAPWAVIQFYSLLFFLYLIKFQLDLFSPSFVHIFEIQRQSRLYELHNGIEKIFLFPLKYLNSLLIYVLFYLKWLGLCIGLGGLMCLYSIEWYARLNCPKSFVSDKFILIHLQLHETSSFYINIEHLYINEKKILQFHDSL